MLNRPLRTALLALAAVAAVPGTAAAKEVTSATVCGADACTSVDDDSLGPALMEGGTPTQPPSQPSAWYRVRLGIGAGKRTFEHFTINVLPRAGLLRSSQELGGAEWTQMSAAQRAIYAETTAGLEPMPAAKLKGLGDPPIPAAGQPPAADDDGGAFPWAIIVVGLALTGITAWAVDLRRRRPAGKSARPA